jgi:uncharacterized protein (TIGR02453 family)
MSAFPGFPKELFSFLTDLAANNDRDWFAANKDRYKHDVAEPMSRFIEAMGEVLPSISEAFVADPRPNVGSMFRIYRDTRFSKDKRPYKENVGCQFRHHGGKDAHAPGFYVHLEPGEVFVGAGMWKPPNPTLNQVRTAIVENPDEWAKVIGNADFKQHFCEFDGESLKRPPKGFDPKHVHLADLKRKSFVVFHDITDEEAQRPEFIDQVTESFTKASPLMRFLTTALELNY